jgi:hypothetical protein
MRRKRYNAKKEIQCEERVMRRKRYNAMDKRTNNDLQDTTHKTKD